MNIDKETELDIKRENYKLRKENFKLIQDNTKLQEEINTLKYKLKEKICMESHSQFKKVNKELETYKKIAEKLAEIFATNENDLCKYLNITDKCKAYAGENKKTCKQCIIDWARKEVEKDD